MVGGMIKTYQIQSHYRDIALRRYWVRRSGPSYSLPKALVTIGSGIAIKEFVIMFLGLLTHHLSYAYIPPVPFNEGVI
jgi:hypothetical protein